MFVLTRGRVIVIAGFILNILLFVVWTVGRYYVEHTEVIPTYGGEYTEGVVGKPVNINPLVAVSDVDRDLCSLIFSGLTKINEDGKLVGDLAANWELSENNLTYTFFLREDALWHDGVPFTADDVVYTLSLVTDINFPGPFTLRNNWLGVEVEKVDDYTVSFKLADPNAAFLENTTIQIVPKHILEGTETVELTEPVFNREPIGTGLYKFFESTSQDEQLISVRLEANKDYWGKTPYIEFVTFKFYESDDDLVTAYQRRLVQGMHTGQTSSIAELEDLKKTTFLQNYLPRYQAAFFNTESEKEFLKSIKVRQALAYATDKTRIINDVLGGEAQAIEGPLPKDSWAYIAPESPITFDQQKARDLLTEEGWSDTDGDGVLDKDGQRLEFSILTDDAQERYQTAYLLAEMWEEVGVNVEVKPFIVGTFIDEYLRKRNYDCAIFGQTLSWDPDVYAFWHSSQIDDPGLNLSKYRNTKIDKYLEDARRLTDVKERKKRYTEFQQLLRNELPAIFLYTPSYDYFVHNTVNNVSVGYMLEPSDRFKSIDKWYVETKRVKKVAD